MEMNIFQNSLTDCFLIYVNRFVVVRCCNNMASLRTVYAMTLLLTLLLTSAPSVWAETCAECAAGSSRCQSACQTEYYDCKRRTRYITDCIRAQSRCYRFCNDQWDPCFRRCTWTIYMYWVTNRSCCFKWRLIKRSVNATYILQQHRCLNIVRLCLYIFILFCVKYFNIQ